MAGPTREDRATRLGKELKAWELQFAASHHGKKPTRDDIKQDSAMALKYSEYHRLRYSSISNTSAADSSKPQGGSRRYDASQTRSPSKSSTTPRKSDGRRDRQQKPAASALEPPQEDSSPAHPFRQFIGLTPQKDGRVIGLFDISPPNINTPSKISSVQDKLNHPAGDAQAVSTILSTPSKTAGDSLETATRETTQQSAIRKSRTPQSSGKRFLLDSFVTPSKRRRLNEPNTPRVNANLADSTGTPAFLQRTLANLPSIHEDALEYSPRRASQGGPRAKKRSLTRSFSSMIADIRQAEDERLDEELELLREMEADDDNEQAAVKSSMPSSDHVLVQDSQAINILGPDGSFETGQQETAADDYDGKPSVFRKKKGQKRQTRRVIMKPRAKAATSAQPMENDDSDEHNEEQAKDNINENSLAPPLAGANKKSATGKGQSLVRKTAKKISATAHANYRRLKIKSSKGAKAAAGGNKRFGRGRR